MSSKHAIRTSLAALGLSLTLGLAACGGSSDDSGGMGGMDHPVSAAPTSSGPSSTGGASTSDEFDDADVMFLQGMVPHHEQAVTMSDTLLTKTGVSAGTTALAREIKAAQQPEIDTMKSWLTAWGKGTDGGMGGMDMGGGMATADELQQLEQARGSEAEKLYLQLMTKHHQGAIAMATMEVGNGKNPGTIELASSIITTQQAEIDTMKQLLSAL